MLLFKILLLGEVCTLLLQMETLQSCHLPAQMDWLSVPRMWKRQTQSMVHLCELCGLEGCGMARETSTQARLYRHRVPLMILIGSEELSHH